MKRQLINTLVSIACAFALQIIADAAFAQNVSSAAASANSPSHTDRSIEYHDGTVLNYPLVDVYLIWYGCWGTTGCNYGSNDALTQAVVSDLVSSIGSSPYFEINTGYPDFWGQAPNGTLFLGGSVLDSYSHGPTLTEADLAAVVANELQMGTLPADPSGIYVVLTSADITVADGATQFCLTCCNLHGSSVFNGSNFRYVFVGNPQRCPGSCGAQPNGIANTPNGSFAGDTMASWLAHALNGTVTDPDDTGWYDRYGLENSEKCEGTYGTTYTVTTPNGQTAQANIRLGVRDYLLQQNWVNGKKGHCAMSPAQ